MMKRFVRVSLLMALVVLVVAAVASAIPALTGKGMQGRWLMAHMAAGSGLVLMLPAIAIAWLSRSADRRRSSWLEGIGYLLMTGSGLAAIGTVFWCMLPLPSTHQMHVLMTVHRYAGLCLAFSVVILLAGLVRSSRKGIRSTAVMT